MVPSFLHRVFARCTDPADMKHHIRFLRKVLDSRNQNMLVINRKFDTFFTKRTTANPRVRAISHQKAGKNKRSIIVKFDGVSKMHLFTQSCILTSYKASGIVKPRILYSSLPKMIAKIVTKRRVLAMVKEKLNLDSES